MSTWDEKVCHTSSHSGLDNKVIDGHRAVLTEHVKDVGDLE